MAMYYSYRIKIKKLYIKKRGRLNFKSGRKDNEVKDFDSDNNIISGYLHGVDKEDICFIREPTVFWIPRLDRKPAQVTVLYCRRDQNSI
jgi:hypothetical protein